MKVYQAINAVQSELSKSGIAKDRENSFDKYKFRGIDDVYNALAPLLAKHQLCVLPRVLSREVVERESQKGGALFYVTVEAEFDFVSAEDGSKHTVKTFGEAMDRGDKATNKAMSAAYKYAAFQAFAIPTEGDNDADAESHQVVADPFSKFTPHAAKTIRAVAQAAIQHFTKGDEMAAFEEVLGCVDKLGGEDNQRRNDVMMALAVPFHDQSALRKYLRDQFEAMNRAEKGMRMAAA